jgi:dienelactone hydrolase
VRDFYAEVPVSDEVFEVYRTMFAYDPMPLNGVVEEADTTEDAIRERVTFDAAYDGDRLQAYVYRPVSGTAPYQVVIQFPGSGAIYQRESRLGTGYIDYIVKSGRALILPIYKGTYERGGELDSDYPEESTRFRNYLIHWVQDVNRTIDYVESRSDLDESKVAYHGFSWGGYLGGIIPAVTPRLSTVVLYVAGLTYQRALPEGEAINYLPRITQPVLMVNGEYDYFFPVETSQRPMFDLLGTPDELKRWIVYPGGHNVPRDMLIKETLDWLDLRLGAVED